MIHLDTGKIGQLDTKTYQEKVEEHNKIHVSITTYVSLSLVSYYWKIDEAI